jgi:hypothetical protein
MSLPAPSAWQIAHPPTAWEIAKELLKEDIVSGLVLPTMAITEIHHLRVEYQRVPYTNFRTNLNNLRKLLRYQVNEAVASAEGLAKDQEKYPVQENAPGSNKPPRWQGSEAERLLKIDVDAGKHDWMTPKELHESSVAYLSFTLEVFRKHIYQLERTGKETPYWLAKKAAKKRKEELEEAELVLD